jgi:hypothetical protein
MGFEQTPTEEKSPEIPQEIKAFWELLEHIKTMQTTPNEHADWLKGITKSLAEKDGMFKEIFSKYDKNDVVGMMDALEEYSAKLTEPEGALAN